MPGTGKGIYIKSNGNDCLDGKTSQLSNLLFEDFTITDPFWYSIWIGPQQQHEPNTELGLDCSLAYPIHNTQCPTQGCSDFYNIKMKDITIMNPKLSPGVLLGNVTNPFKNIIFDNVVVKETGGSIGGRKGRYPWHEESYPFAGTYKSQHVGDDALCVECSPVPDGFKEVSREEYDLLMEKREEL